MSGHGPYSTELRDCSNFADYACGVYFETRQSKESQENDFRATDKEMIVALAKRYAVQIFKGEAESLTWAPSPMTSPREAHVRLEGTDHLLHYRPSPLTGDYEIFLERYCRLCVKTETFEVHSLPELGALLVGKDNR